MKQINKIDLIKTNVFRIGPFIELEKLPVHDSLVELVVEFHLKRWLYKYIIKIKNNYKKFKIYVNKLKINNI